MKQNTLNDSLEVHHLYYLQIMSKKWGFAHQAQKSKDWSVLAKYAYQTKITVGNLSQLE